MYIYVACLRSFFQKMVEVKESKKYVSNLNTQSQQFSCVFGHNLHGYIALGFILIYWTWSAFNWAKLALQTTVSLYSDCYLSRLSTFMYALINKPIRIFWEGSERNRVSVEFMCFWILSINWILANKSSLNKWWHFFSYNHCVVWCQLYIFTLHCYLKLKFLMIWRVKIILFPLVHQTKM
jgi:hypothetical protein